MLALLAYAALYVVGVRRLRGTSRAVPGWRIACFAGGMLVLLAALASPIAGAADEVFWAHMVEHLMIGDLAALLLVLGLTGPLLSTVLRLPGMGALRVLVHPVVAFTLWALTVGPESRRRADLRAVAAAVGQSAATAGAAGAAAAMGLPRWRRLDSRPCAYSLFRETGSVPESLTTRGNSWPSHYCLWLRSGPLPIT